MLLASTPFTFNEDIAWSICLTVGSIFALLGVIERPTWWRVIASGVLILGARGNVGRYALQLAQRAKLHVETLSHGDDEQGLFESLSGSMDAVIDAVGGETQYRAAATLKPGGVLVSAVSPPDSALLAKYRVHGNFMLVDVNAAHLRIISVLLQDGDLAPLVGEVLPLASARIAHEKLDGQIKNVPGKIVLRP